jgi:hypothetical protein
MLSRCEVIILMIDKIDNVRRRIPSLARRAGGKVDCELFRWQFDNGFFRVVGDFDRNEP